MFLSDPDWFVLVLLSPIIIASADSLCVSSILSSSHDSRVTHCLDFLFSFSFTIIRFFYCPQCVICSFLCFFYAFITVVRFLIWPLLRGGVNFFLIHQTLYLLTLVSFSGRFMWILFLFSFFFNDAHLSSLPFYTTLLFFIHCLVDVSIFTHWAFLMLPLSSLFFVSLFCLAITHLSSAALYVSLRHSNQISLFA